MPTNFQLALVGAGRMGQTHLRALAGADRVEVRDVVEPVPAVRDRLVAAGLRVHPTLADLLADTTPDGVLISAPTGLHGDLLRTAVDAGVPILCEKPAGLSSAEVAGSGRYAADRGVALQVAYWRRFVPALVDLRERARQGRFGEIYSVQAWHWDGQPPGAAFRAGSGGIFVDMAVHEFDQIAWLTGQRTVELHAVAAAAISDPDVSGDVDNVCGAYAASGLPGGLGGPGGTAAVPTLSEWAMIMLAALLVLFGVAGIRRHAM